MSARARGAALAVLGALTAGIFAAPGAGCGAGDLPAQLDGGIDASAGCPATLRQTNGAACADEGQVCPVVVDCEVTFELVQCTCRGARWSCADPIGPLEAGLPPRCIAPAPTSKEPCPPSMKAADGATCDDFGRRCYYEGELCDSGITLLDYCSCGHLDGGALAYACRSLSCSPPIELDR
jgi:hypothetical protein